MGSFRAVSFERDFSATSNGCNSPRFYFWPQIRKRERSFPYSICLAVYFSIQPQSIAPIVSPTVVSLPPPLNTHIRRLWTLDPIPFENLPRSIVPYQVHLALVGIPFPSPLLLFFSRKTLLFFKSTQTNCALTLCLRVCMEAPIHGFSHFLCHPSFLCIYVPFCQAVPSTPTVLYDPFLFSCVFHFRFGLITRNNLSLSQPVFW